MKAWKISLAIWGPIVVLSVIYGAVYLIRNSQANHAQYVYTRAIQACETKYAQLNLSTGTALDNPNGNGVAVCQDNEFGIAHGFLGWPVFKVGGVPDDKGTYN